MMYNTSNPAELYSGTTWELLASDKYLKTTTGTPLSTGGSNSFTIQKANLPSVKLQVESFSLTRGTMDIIGFTAFGVNSGEVNVVKPTGAFYWDLVNKYHCHPAGKETALGQLNFQASRSWSGSTSSATPYTQNLGSGTAITVNPTYITIRAWKRLT